LPALPEAWRHGRGFCPGDRSGHDEHPCNLVRRHRPGSEERADRADPIASATGLGRARSRRDLAECRVDLPGGDRSRGRPGRRGRHHQPARDVGFVGPRDRPPGGKRYRMAGSPDSGALRALAYGWPRADRRASDRLGRRPLLFRLESQLVARQYSGATPACPRGRDRFRHDRRFFIVAALRRTASCDGCDQRRAHDVVRHSALYLGCGTAGRVRDPACVVA